MDAISWIFAVGLSSISFTLAGLVFCHGLRYIRHKEAEYALIRFPELTVLLLLLIIIALILNAIDFFYIFEIFTDWTLVLRIWVKPAFFNGILCILTAR